MSNALRSLLAALAALTWSFPAFGMIRTREPGVPVRQGAQSPASVGGEVQLGKLKDPPGVMLTASGGGEEFREIEKFIAEHNAKLKDMEQKEEIP